MCYSHIIIKRISRLYWRYLEISYGDNQSSFKELLKKIALLLFKRETYKYLLQKCEKLLKVCHLLR